MDRIRLHDKEFRLFIPNEKIEAAIEKVADRLNNDYSDEDSPLLLSVLNGSFMFCASLMQKLRFKPELSFIKIASYCGTESSGKTRELIGLGCDVKGRKVIIVEDIVDTGTTIAYLHKLLSEQGAAEIKVCTLFLKPESYRENIPIDYPVMKIGNEFIVGFGLDYDQIGRQYKDIYIID